uniref:Uncharacterized protein LOC117354077 n=1 Tax=Geotrypetes seraphini TaxID=260995 RepID=A0A6P8PSC2_GEOSA|nr:uncharacterized protein LOC117354077 [Geotrypetes seraphini]
MHPYSPGRGGGDRLSDLKKAWDSHVGSQDLWPLLQSHALYVVRMLLEWRWLEGGVQRSCVCIRRMAAGLNQKPGGAGEWKRHRPKREESRMGIPRKGSHYATRAAAPTGRFNELDIGGTILKWFTEFLSTRAYKVRKDNDRSQIWEATCGVPEGLPLSSSLCNIYLSALGRRFTDPQTHVLSHADDIFILTPVKDTFADTTAHIG